MSREHRTLGESETDCPTFDFVDSEVVILFLTYAKGRPQMALMNPATTQFREMSRQSCLYANELEYPRNFPVIH